MKQVGEILKETRLAQNLSTRRVAKNLLLKVDVITAIEEEDWAKLPEPAYIQGYIKNYAKLLGLDPTRLLALFRGQYDAKKFAKTVAPRRRRLMFTPNLIVPLTLAFVVAIFTLYILFQSTAIARSPKLEVATPQDDITTTAAIIEISGQTEKDATVSVDGQLISVDESGNFSYQIALIEGQNIVEIIASKPLSPKTRVTRTIRLSR
ncbi:MAG: helix-turn-helix domain-containing protein [Patescibacteria group bacterium]